jgi:beta-RFAP synthase
MMREQGCKPTEIIVSAPSRLHFGLFSVRPEPRRRFGGMGLMIDEPRTELRVETAEQLECQGVLLRSLVRCWYSRFRSLLEGQEYSFERLPINVEWLKRPRRHVGLGSGTQAAFAVAAALFAYFDIPRPSVEEIAVGMNRGRRSAIGSFGFLRGGLLVDRGLRAGDRFSPLDLRLEFPSEWPIVLVIPQRGFGLFGERERQAFGKTSARAVCSRDEMVRLVKDRIIPAVAGTDYDRFAESFFWFGRRCGELFADVQKGPYHGELAADIVTAVRQWGVPAVAQSSWGPCVFAIARDHDQAVSLVEALRERFASGADQQVKFVLTRANNHGADVKKRVMMRR